MGKLKKLTKSTQKNSKKRKHRKIVENKADGEKFVMYFVSFLFFNANILRFLTQDFPQIWYTYPENHCKHDGDTHVYRKIFKKATQKNWKK